MFASNAFAQVIVNSDGSHSVVHGNVIVNSDGSHSINTGNVIVNSDGSHSIKTGNVIVNSDGSHSIINGNIVVNSDGSHSVINGGNNSINSKNILAFVFGKKDKLKENDSDYENIYNLKDSIQSDSFSFVLESTVEGVKLSETFGCAFKDLSFNLKEHESKAFDQYGMRYIHDKKIKRSTDITPFIIQIKRVQDGFVLKGISGTKFRSLTINCFVGDRIYINSDGIIN